VETEHESEPAVRPTRRALVIGGSAVVVAGMLFAASGTPASAASDNGGRGPEIVAPLPPGGKRFDLDDDDNSGASGNARGPAVGQAPARAALAVAAVIRLAAPAAVATVVGARPAGIQAAAATAVAARTAEERAAVLTAEDQAVAVGRPPRRLHDHWRNAVTTALKLVVDALDGRDAVTTLAAT
jgi:hypothetical protein